MQIDPEKKRKYKGGNLHELAKWHAVDSFKEQQMQELRTQKPLLCVLDNDVLTGDKDNMPQNAKDEKATVIAITNKSQ